MVYDIFISYRRKNISHARNIYYALKDKGYTNIFFDMDSIREGKFPNQIEDAVKSCTNFILVLSEGSMDRCANAEDWVAKEIQLALENQKNILPIVIGGNDFKWPDNFPDKLKEIKSYQDIKLIDYYFNAGIELLIGRLKTNKPSENTASDSINYSSVQSTYKVSAPQSTPNSTTQAAVSQNSQNIPTVPDFYMVVKQASGEYVEGNITTGSIKIGSRVNIRTADGHDYQSKVLDILDLYHNKHLDEATVDDAVSIRLENCWDFGNVSMAKICDENHNISDIIRSFDASMVVKSVYKRDFNSVNIVAEVTKGSFNEYDVVYFKSNSEQLYGPCGITRVMPNGDGNFVFTLTGNLNFKNSVYPGWTGKKY